MEAYVAEEWSKKWSVTDPVEACELETVAYIVQTIGEHCTQDPELCSGIIQDHTALVAKGEKEKGKEPNQVSTQSVLPIWRWKINERCLQI